MATVRPAFDPELEAVLGMVNEMAPSSLTPDMIPQSRATLAANTLVEPTVEMLREQVEVDEFTVPGPADAPDISLLVLRPRGVTTILPGVYDTHGGGMVMGSCRTGLPALVDWMREIPMVVEYARRIWQAGGNAELHVWVGGFHGFDSLGTAAVSQASVATRYTWLRRILGV